MNVTWIGSPNFYPLVGIRKRYIVMHWMVGTLRSTDSVFQSRTRRVSAHYGVENHHVHQYVRERNYAFANGTSTANTRGISIEHAGGYVKDGKRVRPSKATHETSARLCAEIARRHRLGKLVVGKNIYRHSHFIPTACPGTLDVSWIANRANDINAAR
jgi:N-acetyl-anhydromuramyl-L-alanine amidase AmpD